MLRIKIDTGNAAFSDPYSGEHDKYYEGCELNRCLRKIIENIEDGRMFGAIFDINGNKVGSWTRM